MAVLTSNLLPSLPTPQFQSSSVFTICVVNLTVTPTAALHCFRSYYDKHLNDEWLAAQMTSWHQRATNGRKLGAKVFLAHACQTSLNQTNYCLIRTIGKMFNSFKRKLVSECTL